MVFHLGFALAASAVKYTSYASRDNATADMRVYYAKSNTTDFVPIIFIDIDRDFTMGSKTYLYCECSTTVHIAEPSGIYTHNLLPEEETRVDSSHSDIINRSFYHRECTGAVLWELVFHSRTKIKDSWNLYEESHARLVTEWRSRVQNNTCEHCLNFHHAFYE